MFLGGWEMLFGFLTRGGYISTRREKFSLESGSGPESEQILHIANESLARFKFKVRRIGLGLLPWFQGVGTLAWQEGLPWYWCRFKRRKLLAPPEQVVLSAGLRGRLEPEDWKVLFSYYLLSRKVPLRVLVSLIIWMFGPLLFLAIVFVREAYGIQSGSLYAQAIFLPLFVVWFVSPLLLAKSSSLRKDRMVARFLGGTILLGSFRKIDRLELKDVENGKRRRGLIAFFWPMPNMTERIANLESESRAF